MNEESYVVSDPEGAGIIECATFDEAKERFDECLAEWRGRAIADGEWSDGVESLSILKRVAVAVDVYPTNDYLDYALEHTRP